MKDAAEDLLDQYGGGGAGGEGVCTQQPEIRQHVYNSFNFHSTCNFNEYDNDKFL